MKLCECGCGEPAPIAKQTNRSRGWVKGMPKRFIHGHKYRQPLAERFWSKVAKRGPDQCWEWVGQMGTGGYGTIVIANKHVAAPRVAWQLDRGAAPGDLHVLHRCDNPPCVNPAHLFLGTHADNMADMAAKGRSGMAKLTVADVRTIREWAPAGWTHRDLGAAFGVDHASIGRILRGETWAHA